MSHIAIAGAGIAGLACAINLFRLGHTVSVFEHVSDPTPVGAGLLLQPSGQTVLANMNLLEPVRAQAAIVRSLQGYSRQRRVLDLHYEHIDPHWHGLGIHRASLHAVLWQAVQQLSIPIRLGTAITQFTSSKNGVHVVIDDQLESFDALIIANGTRSQLRQQLTIAQRCTPYPWGAFWAVLDHDAWPYPEILMQRYRGAQIMLGVLPTGKNPRNGNTCYSLFWSLPRAQFGAHANLISLVAAITPIWSDVAQWLQSAPTTTIAIAEYADVRMSQWHQGRVVVVGDAAHAMSPQLGQGANLALIDAQVLAQCLQQHQHITEAFAHYSTRRRAHLKYYQFASNIMTPLYQSAWPIGWLRDAGTVIGRHIPPLYRHYLLTLCGAKQGLLDGQAQSDQL